MASNVPTRIDDDLFAAAKAAGAMFSRSAAQQVNHWARIGRQFEASAAVSQRDITRVLGGSQSYDTLTTHEQAVVRAEWDERMIAVRESLDFTGELAASGHAWAEADAEGKTVLHPAGRNPRRQRRAAPAPDAAPTPAIGKATAKTRRGAAKTRGSAVTAGKATVKPGAASAKAGKNTAKPRAVTAQTAKVAARAGKVAAQTGTRVPVRAARSAASPARTGR